MPDSPTDRMRAWSPLLALTFALSVLIAPAAQAAKILIIGDSISTRLDGTQNVQGGVRSWAFLLEQANPSFEWVNIATPGATTRSWTSPAGFDAIEPHRDADIVLLLLGMADGSLEIPTSEWSLRMASIAAVFENPISVSLIYQPVPGTETGDALRDAYNDFIIDEAPIRWSVGADFRFLGDESALQDGIHLNQAGQVAAAQAVAARFPFLIPEPTTSALLAVGLLGLGLNPRKRKR